MSCSIRIVLATCALVAAAAAFPAQAQLHGDWPTDAPWSTARNTAATQAERANAHASPAALDAPRGDLRRDVAEASRDLPPHHGR